MFDAFDVCIEISRYIINNSIFLLRVENINEAKELFKKNIVK